jgi:chromosome segregation ATPase
MSETRLSEGRVGAVLGAEGVEDLRIDGNGSEAVFGGGGGGGEGGMVDGGSGGATAPAERYGRLSRAAEASAVAMAEAASERAAMLERERDLAEAAAALEKEARVSAERELMTARTEADMLRASLVPSFSGGASGELPSTQLALAAIKHASELAAAKSEVAALRELLTTADQTIPTLQALLSQLDERRRQVGEPPSAC